MTAAARPARKGRPPASAGRPRTAARLAAVQALYQAEHAGISPETVLDEFVRHRVGGVAGEPLSAGPLDDGAAPGADVPLLARIVRGYAVNAEALDAVVTATLAEDWPLARLDPVLRRSPRTGLSRGWTRCCARCCEPPRPNCSTPRARPRVR